MAPRSNHRALVAVATLFVLAWAPDVRASTILLFDDFEGGVIAGAPSSGVSFTTSTAVLPSNDDGVDYGPEFLPGGGSIDVRLRVDEVGAKNAVAPGGTSPLSVILDSKGALGRSPGDLFVFVETDGLVRFTLNEGIEQPRDDAIHQVVSSTSILDGQFHTVGITYGSSGMTISIDGAIEDTEPFTRLVSARRFSLADYDEQSGAYPDSDFGFGFVGEVDWIQITEEEQVPEPSTLLLISIGFGFAFRKSRRV